MAKANKGLWFDYGGMGMISLICLFEIFDALGK